MKKKLILLIMIVFLCSGCLDKIAQKKQQEDEDEKNQIKEKGLPIVKDYIKQKYGFVFEESDIDKISYPCNYDVHFGCDGYSGIMEIYANHYDKKYFIRVNTDSNYCVDNYEKDVLVEKIKDYYSKYLNIDKNKLTIYAYNNEFLNNEIVTDKPLNELIPSPSTIDLITYDKLNDDGVKEIISSINNKEIKLKFIETKDYDSYVKYLNILQYDGEKYNGSYSYYDDFDNLLNGYYTYDHDYYKNYK